MQFSTGGTCMSGCFSWSTSATGRPVFMHWSSRRRQPTPYLLVDRQTGFQSLPNRTVLGYLRDTALSSSSVPLVALPALETPSASGSPTRPAWKPLSQRSIRLVICARISRALHTPNVFIRTTWAKARGLSEFQLLSITHRYSAGSMAVKRRPTAPEGVVYQLSECAASRHQ